jgi:hypothetical protein
MPEHAWVLFPTFILRSTGFPFGWIQNLAFPETSAALDALIACEDEIAGHRTVLQNRLREGDPASIPVRRRAWKHVNKWQAPRVDAQDLKNLPPDLPPLIGVWDGLLHRREELQTSAGGCFEGEMACRRRALRGIAQDAWFQEAVWLSSPQMYEHGLERYLRHWDERARPSDIRSAERQIVSFLQRFCAKNDTTSFFGPINYGDFEVPAEAPSGPGPEHIGIRRGTIAYWAANAIAEAMARDGSILPYLTPRRLPLARLDPAARTLLVGRSARIAFDAVAARTFELCNGERTIESLAAMLAVSTEHALEIVRRLERCRAVALPPEIPVTALSPIDWLLAWAEQLPGNCASRSRWVQTLSEFAGRQKAFGPASFPEKRRILTELEQAFPSATGQPARHSGGAFYADRLLIYEECLGGMTPLSLGPRFAARLEGELVPVLELLGCMACGVREQLASFGAGLLDLWYGGKPTPWLDFVARLSREKPCFKSEATPWEQALYAQVREAGGRHEVRIGRGALPPTDPALMSAWPLIASPDVMLLANHEDQLRSGDFDIVLSECHDTLMLWGWALSFHPDWHSLERKAALLLERARGNWRLANVLTSRRVKIMPFEYPGATIELMARGSGKPGDEKISPFDVEVRSIDGRLCLVTSGGATLLYNGELDSLAHSLFSLPRVVPLRFDNGRHTPRIRLGRVVVQRERWRVLRRDLFSRPHTGSSPGLFKDFRRAVRELGLPRYLYASIPGQPKPVFIDCENYLLIEMLYSFAPEEGDLVLVEMLPGPDRLWLTDGSNRYTSELRLSACYLPGNTITSSPR